MKRIAMAALAAGIASSAAFGGGIERGSQSVAFIFEPGNYVQFSFASVKPQVSGVGAGAAVTAVTPTPGVPTGSIIGSYSMSGVAFKMPLNDKVDIGFVTDQPFGAGINYPLTGFYASGAVASLDSRAFTGVLKYKFDDRFSAYAGLRAHRTSANIALLPTLFPPSGYTASGADTAYGYLVGVAYEKPEIALRVALTYNSAIKHKVTTTEDIGLGPTTTTTPLNFPQSVNLEVQSGIAKDTLAFGSIRWVEWSKFDVAPPAYVGAAGEPIVAFSNDVFTYTLGVGRRLSDNWAVSGRVSYEKSNGGFASALSPTDGNLTVGLGVTYTHENMKVTAGVGHSWIGDAETEIGGSGVAAGTYTGNTATIFGMQIAFNF